MLLNLTIANIAVFKDITINFENGYNVITGETGSGKSVLIDALKLLIGYRANKKLIRNGCKSAYVSGTFDINNQELYKILQKHDIKVLDDDYLLISREIFENGKSINKINSRNVTISLLNEISLFLFDVYDQFDSSKLYKKDRHIELLDSICDEGIKNCKLDYSKLYYDYKKAISKKKDLESKLESRDIRLEQYKFEIDEIVDADLKAGEEEDLLRTLKKLSNIKNIKSDIATSSNMLNSDENSVLNDLNVILSKLSKLNQYDEKIETISERLDLSIQELQDISIEISEYFDDLDIDNETIEIIDERLSLINRIKRKYGYSIEDVNSYLVNVRKDFDDLLHLSSNLDNLYKYIDEIKNRMLVLTNKIKKMRVEAKSYLEKQLPIELENLNMKNINFLVNIDERTEFNENGLEDIEFYISTNVGANLQQLNKVVSGGEASRIMLALKKMSNSENSTSTIILDEIDTGISGKTARMAGLMISSLSRKAQIICITHSPQIAALTYNHYVIDKSFEENETFARIYKLDEEARLNEVARLLSGIDITENSINNAMQLISESIS